MTTNRPSTVKEIATALQTVADRLATLGELPMSNPGVRVDILPHGGEDVEVAAIDAIGRAVTGKPGQTEQYSDGSYHHTVSGHVDGIQVHAFTSVSSPVERKMRAELAQLRARLGELDTAAGHAGGNQ